MTEDKYRPTEILYYAQLRSAHRETREGWPLLTVETEVNGNSKGALPWLVRWARHAGIQETLILLWLL
jgi:hypothetical protein